MMSLRDREEDLASLDDDNISDDSFDTKSQISQIIGYYPTAPVPDFQNITPKIDNDNKQWKPARVRKQDELKKDLEEEQEWNQIINKAKHERDEAQWSSTPDLQYNKRESETSSIVLSDFSSRTNSFAEDNISHDSDMILDASIEYPDENLFALATIDGKYVDRRSVSQLSGAKPKTPTMSETCSEIEEPVQLDEPGEKVERPESIESIHIVEDEEKVMSEFTVSASEAADESSGCCSCWTRKKKKVAPMK